MSKEKKLKELKFRCAFAAEQLTRTDLDRATRRIWEQEMDFCKKRIKRLENIV